MKLRKYNPEDLSEILELFFATVHTVNAKDYSEAQLNAWAPRMPDREKWKSSLGARCSFVAEEEGRIVGFGDIDASGYLDRLYVAADMQKRGIGRALCEALEEYARKKGARRIVTYASLTARPFFERLGYRLEGENRVERSGVYLTNFLMIKCV